MIEDRRADLRVCRGTSPDDQEVAADIMADLQHHQEVESQMLLTLHGKVKNTSCMLSLYNTSVSCMRDNAFKGVTCTSRYFESFLASQKIALK